MTLLGKRYATALLLAAKDARAVDQIAGDLAALHQELLVPAVRALLTSPDIGAVEREHVLGKLGAGRHQLVQNLLFVLQRRHRIEVMFDVYPAYRAQMLAERGEIEGTVETPLPLAADELQQMQELAARLAGAAKVSLAARIRPELLGGARLTLGHVLYDGSLRTALDQMEQQLRAVPI
jgi:F-type H+-transporting ATPase subunit delta